jgi:hypothetical protein
VRSTDRREELLSRINEGEAGEKGGGCELRVVLEVDSDLSIISGSMFRDIRLKRKEERDGCGEES